MAEKLTKDDLCTKTGKKHEPDWLSINVGHDREGTYLDVNCKDCGKSGCVGVVKWLSENINW